MRITGRVRWCLLDKKRQISSHEDVQSRHHRETWSFALNAALPQATRGRQLIEETTSCLGRYIIRKLNDLLSLLWSLPHYKMPKEDFSGQSFLLEADHIKEILEFLILAIQEVYDDSSLNHDLCPYNKCVQ